MIFAYTLCPALVASAWTYKDIQIEGWHVHVEEQVLLERPKAWVAAKDELSCQLMRIERVVPDGPLAKLKSIPLFIRLNDPYTKGAAFHPDKGWLVDHGLDPAMAHGVEFGNLENLIKWPYEQPWMAMHELAHAYHDLFLPGGFDNSEIRATYDAALASHKYDSVLWYDGGVRRAYALTNQMEYFAETTESYFGRNDGYPFVRAELKTFDPQGYALMRKMWGDPAAKVPKG